MQLGAVLLILEKKEVLNEVPDGTTCPHFPARSHENLSAMGVMLLLIKTIRNGSLWERSFLPARRAQRDSAVVSCAHYKWALTLEFEVDGVGSLLFKFRNTGQGCKHFIDNKRLKKKNDINFF